MYDNESINKLTDHDKKYKLTNTYLSASYNSLNPPKLSRVATAVFNFVIMNKMYGSVGKAKHPHEVHRIFNDVRTDVDRILREVNAGKYEDGGLFKKGKKIETDRANMANLIKQIDSNNIFYVWKYKENYMFFIERHIAAWKCYNVDAVIPPKTIGKISKIAHLAIDTMMKFEHQSGRLAVRYDIENSYCRFVSRLITGMSPAVGVKMPDWDSCNSFVNYIDDVNNKANKLSDFDGLNVDDSFAKRIPPSARNILESGASKEKSKMKDNSAKTEMEKELTPKNANVRSNKGKRVKTTKKKSPKKKETQDQNPSELDMLSFGGSVKMNPFLDAPTFAIYYRAFISLHSEQSPKFGSIATFTEDAGYILDRLGELGKKGDMQFLEAWLKDFIATGLKGRKIQNTQYTDMKNLYGTLNKFNEIFYIPQ